MKINSFACHLSFMSINQKMVHHFSLKLNTLYKFLYLTLNISGSEKAFELKKFLCRLESWKLLGVCKGKCSWNQHLLCQTRIQCKIKCCASISLKLWQNQVRIEREKKAKGKFSNEECMRSWGRGARLLKHRSFLTSFDTCSVMRLSFFSSFYYSSSCPGINLIASRSQWMNAFIDVGIEIDEIPLVFLWAT